MKKLILASCLFLIAISASAEVNFLENPVWSTVLEKAKKENKIIFLDGFATWCGPCKKMDAETYKDPAVAAYFNANFINVKYDMEKGEGKTLAEKYMVQAYPSLLFINSDGVMVHKGVGFLEATEFQDLGQKAKNPGTQYYTLKKKALELSNADFEKFAAMAVAFEDQDADLLFEQYLAKQPDILANDDLISLVMLHITAFSNEKMLGYLKDNKAKVIKSGKFTSEDYDERMVSLALGYGLSESVQLNPDELDFASLTAVLDKYIPEKSFFVSHYFKAQYLLDNKKTDEALAEFNVLIDNVPAKITYDQICNAMMNMGAAFEKEGQLEPVMKKFEAISVPTKDANKAYLKDFVKAIIAIKNNQMDKFKMIATAMIAKPDSEVPANVKEDLKSALDRVSQK